MCDPVTAGLILTAASGGASAINNNQTLRRKDAAAAEGIRRQGRIDSDANDRVNAEVNKIATNTGADERAQALDGFLNALRASKDSTEGSLAPVAGANQRFAESVSGGKASLAREGAGKADRLSRITGPLAQRQNEVTGLRRTASDLGELSRRSRAEDFLTRLRVDSERPNQLVEVLAAIGKGAGSALTLGATAPVNAVGTGGTAVTSPFTGALA